MVTTSRGLTIGQLARTAGVNLETVRYYENIGLIPAPPRTEGGHRSYNHAHIRRLAFIRRARELGFRIEDIRTLLTLAEPDHLSCGDVRTIASRHRADVRSKMADLARLEAVLADTIDLCVGGPAVSCPILDFLDS